MLRPQPFPSTKSCLWFARVAAPPFAAMYRYVDVPDACAVLGLSGWIDALTATPGIVEVRRMVSSTGASTKSPVSADIVARGGGHFCTHEVEFFVGKVAKKNRVVSGLSKHGGNLHVYIREAPWRIADDAQLAFYEAVALFLAQPTD